jgi:hypothetical protein
LEKKHPHRRNLWQGLGWQLTLLLLLLLLLCRSFDGADVRGAQFENSILTGATFGKDSAGNWANLAGAHFEGALVSSSDIGRICENPTLEADTKRYELGCRATR